MSANYAIYTSPSHQPIPDHLPTLIVTPQGKPQQVLYTYLHTNCNQENYLLTPSDQGDLCVAKLFPPKHTRKTQSSTGHPQSTADRSAIKCEASRNLKWTIRNEGIQNPVYKLTLPNPENPQIEQPLFQVSKPNPNCPWWTLFYFTYAGHLIPPKRIEFGKILKAQPNGSKSSGETKITVTGKTEEEKAVWRTLGEGNEDMVEWILVCAALNVLDEEISKAAEAAGVQLSARPSATRAPPQTQQAPHPAPQKPHAHQPQPQGHHPAPRPGSGGSPIPSSQRAPAYHPQQQQQVRGPPASNGLPPGAMHAPVAQRGPVPAPTHPHHHPKPDHYNNDLPSSDLAYARAAPARHPLPPPHSHPHHHPQQQQLPPRAHPSPQHYPQHQQHHPSPPRSNPLGPRQRHPSTPPTHPPPTHASRAPIQVPNYPIQTHAHKQAR
ncbi:hypothetical protein PtB15_13B221 [Puccinia triticina]|nr:hypothetical protein PtB15_13B221 [Puccinia triticina]